VGTDENLVIDRPDVSIGTRQEYAEWISRLREAFQRSGGSPDAIEQVDARYNYSSNRITLYRMPDPFDPLSISQTPSHEFLRALLYWSGERTAARMIDLVAKPVGSSERVGGV
jgi:hypothetical protein